MFLFYLIFKNSFPIIKVMADLVTYIEVTSGLVTKKVTMDEF